MEIGVPAIGEALLMVNPAGLSRLLCLKLVTPRGVAKKVPRVEARPESFCKLDLAKVDLGKRVKTTSGKYRGAPIFPQPDAAHVTDLSRSVT